MCPYPELRVPWFTWRSFARIDLLLDGVRDCGASSTMDPVNSFNRMKVPRDWGHEVARWMRRASKGASLLKGRLKALRARIDDDTSLLLPIVAHRHYWAGAHEDSQSLHFIVAHLPQNGVFFDVGANVGIYLAAVHVLSGGGVSLVGFEPVPSTLAILQETLSVNGVPARIEPIALSHGEGELRLSAYAGGRNNFWIRGDTTEHPCISVRTASLDQWLSHRPGLVPDVIKIDVEGHELEVLEGAAELLAKHRPALMVECHGASWDELGVPRSRFASLLAAAGYRNLQFADGSAVDFAGLQRTVHLFATT